MYQMFLAAREFLVPIVIFGALLTYVIIRGRRALTALILGLYLALLISLKFPYYENLYAALGQEGEVGPVLTILIFVLFTSIGAVLFERLLYADDREGAFESIVRKIILAALGAIIIIAYSYHVLPVTRFVDPGSATGAFFAPPEYFFWLMLIPLVGLFLV